MDREKRIINTPRLALVNRAESTYEMLPRIVACGHAPADLYTQAPTIRELHNAYFGRDGEGWESIEYRQAVHSEHGYGECTSTFLLFLPDGRAGVIERPTELSRHGKKRKQYDRKWKLRLLTEAPVIDIPDDGFVLEYNGYGLPARTCTSRREAKQAFGDDTSYFFANNKYGLRAVTRSFPTNRNFGPFFIDATHDPAHKNQLIGVRPIVRSEHLVDVTFREAEILMREFDDWKRKEAA
ncbi:hypothetical protein ACFLQN_00295 [Candidatus Aenigmatarchaeota archaeon]